jgi:FixJ family two-component response regulator
LAREFPDELRLLVTDVIMPEMNGRELAREILALHPNLRHLFMSGYPADIIADHGVLDDGVNFIHKPFSRKDLGNKVREVLKPPPSEALPNSPGA